MLHVYSSEFINLILESILLWNLTKKKKKVKKNDVQTNRVGIFKKNEKVTFLTKCLQLIIQLIDFFCIVLKIRRFSYFYILNFKVWQAFNFHLMDNILFNFLLAKNVSSFKWQVEKIFTDKCNCVWIIIIQKNDINK